MDSFRVRNKKFNTWPIVFHHPGVLGGPNNIGGILMIKKLFFQHVAGDKGDWFFDRKEQISLKRPSRNEPVRRTGEEKLTVILISNLDELGSAARSLDHLGISYRVLGQGVTDWKNSEKIRLLNEEVARISTPYFMLMDTDDVFVIGQLDQAVSELEQTENCEMLINAAQNFWPEAELEPYDVRSFCDSIGEEVQSDHKYVNSGVFITRTEFYRSIVDELDVEKAPLPGDDQSLFYLLYKKYFPKIQLDHSCRVFQCEFDQELEIHCKSLRFWERVYVHTEHFLYPLWLWYQGVRRRSLEG